VQSVRANSHDSGAKTQYFYVELRIECEWKQTSNLFQLCFHSSLQVTLEVETERKQSGTMFQLPSVRSPWEEIT
jgi:hypothetical protein